MRTFLLTITLFTFMNASANAENTSNMQLLEKQVEILQHTTLSIHLNKKCNYLSEPEADTLMWGESFIGAELEKNPENNLGRGSAIFINVKMHERSMAIPCNSAAKDEVMQSLRNIIKLRSSLSAR